MRKTIVIIAILLSSTSHAVTRYQLCDSLTNDVIHLFMVKRDGGSRAQVREEAISMGYTEDVVETFVDEAFRYSNDSRLYYIRQSFMEFCMRTDK